MHNRRLAKTAITLTIMAIITVYFMGVASSSDVLAEETGKTGWGTADGDGIIEPSENPEEEMARAAQNPVSDLISVPFQNNTNFNFGPQEKTQNVLNIQPVWPFSLGDRWNLITRTIFPVISQPETLPGTDQTFGLGNITFTAFLSPKAFDKLIWGVGPVLVLPTNTDDYLGPDRWSGGASFVVLTMPGRWVIGSLVSNVWDFAGADDVDINFFTWQYFINYNLPNGWYLTSSPIITANWEADSGNQWTVPLGGGVGKIIWIGKLPLNVSVQAFYNVEKPDFGADWQLRAFLQFMFPKSR